MGILVALLMSIQILPWTLSNPIGPCLGGAPGAEAYVGAVVADTAG